MLADKVPRRSPTLRFSTESPIKTVDNPFTNPAPWTGYEKFKAVIVGFTLFPCRLVLLLCVMPLMVLFAKLASMGHPLEEDRGCYRHMTPFQRWRMCLLVPVALLNRLALLCFGFWRINVRDLRQDLSHKANILVVAPHQTFLDLLVIAWAFPPYPSGVGKSDILKMPGMSALTVAGQTIFVDRKNAESRHACKDAIEGRADVRAWKGPPSMIFPEGTTTNGNVLIQFKVGAFCSGHPVLPVCLKFPHKHYNPGWCGRNESLPLSLLRIMLQFANHCEIDILEAYVPSEAERQEPILFGNNVRKAMARHLGIGTTEHSYDDAFLAAQAVETTGNFEVAELKSAYNFAFDDLAGILKKFHKMDRDKSGTLSQAEFSEVIRSCSLGSLRGAASVDKLFSFFDQDGSGCIDYVEFVQGSALMSGKCSASSRAKLAFLILDVEGTGKVRRGLLQKSIDSGLAHALNPFEIPQFASPGTRLMSIATLSDPTVREEIGFEEFKTVVNENPEILDAALQVLRDRLVSE